MTTLRIGRFGGDIVQGNVQAVTIGPGKVELAGRLSTVDPDEVAALTRQLVGLVATDDGNGSDEDAVPLEVEGLDDLTGLWRVTDAGVDLVQGSLVNGWPAFKVSLESVGPCVWESQVTGGLLDNDIDVTASGDGVVAQPVHAVPAASTEHTWFGDDLTRVSATGDVLVRRGAVTDGSDVFPYGSGSSRWAGLDRLATWSTPAGNHYDGAAGLHLFHDGVNLDAISGRVIPAGQFWSIGNGLFQVFVQGDQVLAGTFDGTDWRYLAWSLRHDGTPITFTGAVSVIRNNPTTAAVKVGFTMGDGDPYGPDSLYITVRRGMRFASFRAVVSALATPTWSIAQDGGPDSVGITGGFANDAPVDGVTPFVASNLVLTGVGGAMTATPPDGTLSWSFALGASISTDPGEAPADLALQWLAGQAEYPRAVKR